MERLVDIMVKERENYENTVLEVGAEVEITIDELIEEEGFESIRDGVIELVKKLSATEANAEMTRYITEMFPETRLSETGEIHKDKLIAARDYLIALAEKVNG